MFKLIDLSHPIDAQTPTYPGDAPVQLYKTKRLEKDGFTNYQLEIGMHSGTHLDGPMHLTEAIKYISEIPLESFYSEGCILDVRGEPVIRMKEQYRSQIKEGSIVLFYTGWDQKYGNPEYFTDQPEIHPELAEFIISKKTKIIGMDLASPDYAPFKVHRMFLNEGVLILENLTNLGALLDVEQFEVMAFPLKIKTDSSPLRVVARVIK
jgi:kynurenine formamidase